MPNLENLKKQAKQYLRWHREQYYPVAAQIRTTLPRFHAMGDMEIMASNFKLADAQELVARLEGFEGWHALLLGADAMNELPKQMPSRPFFTAIEPQLFVADLQPALEFYTKKLGFGVAFVYGEPPFYAQVNRDEARLNLRLVSEPVFDSEIRKRDGLLSATITVATASELKQLFLDYQASEVHFYQALKKEPWGSRTFVVPDPDGNLLLFAGPAD